jgi:hypothetical protein
MVMRALRLPAVFVLAVALLMGGNSAARAASPCGALVGIDQCLDDFTCYKVTRPAHNPVTVTLTDQFESVTAQVSRPFRLCTPSDRAGEGTVDPATHMTSYIIRMQNPHTIERTGIRMTNALGDIWLNTTSAGVLLVPASKDLTSLPGQPSATAHVDHYKCYRTKVTPGTPKFARNTRVSVADQFSPTPRDLTLLKPRWLCTPVDKNNEGIANPDIHLVCYTARPALGEPQHMKVRGIFVNDQFGPKQVNTRREAELCLPSTKSFSPAP